MIDALEKLNELGWFYVVLTLVLSVVLVVGAIELFKKLKSSLGLKSAVELEREQTQKDITDLKQQVKDLDGKIENKFNTVENELHTYEDDHYEDCMKWRGQSVDIRNNLDQHINTLVEKFDKYIEMDNRRTIATLRTSLWRLHRDFMEQGYVTPDGLKTWIEMGKVYVEAGGNDIFHDKLDPEVSALPIRYPDDSIYGHD